MSIYVSSFELSDSGDFPVAGRAPLVYAHSGNRPSDQGERRGSLELAYIPGFIDGSSDKDEPHLPWLRVGLESTDAYLGQWLDNTVGRASAITTDEVSDQEHRSESR